MLIRSSLETFMCLFSLEMLTFCDCFACDKSGIIINDVSQNTAYKFPLSINKSFSH